MIIKSQVPKTYCCSSFQVLNEITLDEIEINDHFKMKGHNANIIKGVGEDETLSDAVSLLLQRVLILNSKMECK
jgi:hypothetical protein